MPFQIGSVAIHNDGQHTGSAKRDVANGLAGLDAGGDILAPGANLELTRDGNGDIKILERTSGETVAVMRRTGANAYTWYNNTVAGGKILLDNSMDLSATYAVAAKGVTNGDAHDHAGGDGGQVSYAGLSSKLFTTMSAPARAVNTTYQNTSSLPMMVVISAGTANNSDNLFLSDSATPPTTVVAGVYDTEISSDLSSGVQITAIVQPSHYYRYNGAYLRRWTEYV